MRAAICRAASGWLKKERLEQEKQQRRLEGCERQWEKARSVRFDEASLHLRPGQATARPG